MATRTLTCSTRKTRHHNLVTPGDDHLPLSCQCLACDPFPRNRPTKGHLRGFFDEDDPDFNNDYCRIRWDHGTITYHYFLGNDVILTACFAPLGHPRLAHA